VCVLRVLLLYNHTHTPGEHGDLGSPLGAAPHRCGLGLPAARAATRKKAKDETRPAIVTSSTFLASHHSAPGGSFALRIMECYSAGKGQGSDRSGGEMQALSFLFLLVLLMRILRLLHVWPHCKLFRVPHFQRLSQSCVCVCVCVCARQSPLACPEASLPNLHGSVIAKFKQWPRGDHSTTPYPQTRQTRWGRCRAQRNQSFAYIAARIRTLSESVKNGGKPGRSRQGRTSQRGSPKEGFDEHTFDVPVRGPTSQLEATQI
jgi:hypothetical protein